MFTGGSSYIWRTTGVPVPLSGQDQNWESGHPDGVALGQSRDCGAMSGQKGLKWISDDCISYVNIPVCEKNGEKCLCEKCLVK